MRTKTLILALTGLLSTASGAAPQTLDSEAMPAAAIDKQTQTDEVAIKNDGADRMTVDVFVGGRGPYKFLVDTGSERTAISRQLAGQLKLEAGEKKILHSVIGANNVNTVYIPHLRVSSNVVSVVDAPTLEASNMGADGMLGIDSLRSQRVLFNFKTNTMAITPSSTRLERLHGDEIVVTARRRNGRLVFTNAVIDGEPVTVIVDTGSQVTIGNLALQRRLARRDLVNVPEPVTIESVTGEKAEAHVAQLKKLDLGGVTLANIAMAFTDAHVFKQLHLDERPAILLGMNAMRAFDKVSIDFELKKVRFVLPGTSMRREYRLAMADKPVRS